MKCQKIFTLQIVTVTTTIATYSIFDKM